MSPFCWSLNVKQLAVADRAARGQASWATLLLFQLAFLINPAIGLGCLWLWA
jgi:hypothetical protein